ncbi:MAG: hypothetical protein FJ278_15160, partial [Planctomycetes bacterium]|nr:hypothetical protein [Planctomycetota bacterium]
WQGALDLLASRLQARLTIRQAEVSASRPTRAPADVVLRCDDETASRIVLGRETPFEAFLQSRLNIAPRVTESLTRLLETVFPKLPVL